MTSIGPDPANRNPFDPPPAPPPPPVDSSIDSLNSYFAQQPAVAGVDPLTQPHLFVRPPRGRSLRRQRLITLGAAALVLLCCGGLVYAFGNRDDDERDATSPVAGSRSGATPTYIYSPPPTVAPTVAPTTTPPTAAPPTPSGTGNALDAVKENDCLKNTGTDADPEMVPTACGKGTYKVLKRLYGTVDSSRCQSVRGTTTSYIVTYYRNGIPVYGLSYVFCLKRP